MTSKQMWQVMDYEVQMFYAMRVLRARLSVENHEIKPYITNAVVEASLLHIRNLAEILIGAGYKDDISLENLGISVTEFPDLQKMTTKLNSAYGKNDTLGSCRWTINKMFAHPTIHRADSFNYSEVFKTLEPLIDEIIRHIYSEAKRDITSSFYLIGW